MSINYKMLYIEDNQKNFLLRKTPVIIRIDGKAFSSYTNRFERPFDPVFRMLMEETARFLLSSIQGAVCAYTQSDEISLLLTDYAKENSDAWYGYNQQKLVSVTASMATGYFNSLVSNRYQDDIAFFDGRAFNIPFEDVVEYFLYRRADGERNFINTLGRSIFSQKQLSGIAATEVENMVKTAAPSFYETFNQPKYRYGYFLVESRDSENKASINHCSPLSDDDISDGIEKFLKVGYNEHSPTMDVL